MSRFPPSGLILLASLSVLAGTLTDPLFAREALAAKRPPPVVGRWNLTMTAPDGSTFPSWLELTFDTKSGDFGGRLVGRTGRPRSIEHAEWKKNELSFSVPPVVPAAPAASAPPAPPGRTYRAKVRFGMLEGTAEAAGEPTYTFLAARPPKFANRGRLTWGKPVPLLSRGLIGWRLRDSRHGTCWKENAGVLESKPVCADIISDGRYQDFKLHLEVKLPKGGATGVFLRGRYEVQLADDAGKPPSDESSGAIFGFTAPRINAALAAGEWQTLDATLIGRKVTVVLNGQTVLDNQEIIGPTGDAIDSDEQIPGSIMLEAEKGPLAFRNLVVTPASW